VPENPVAWLYRVARNLAEKQRSSDERRRKREHLRARWGVATNDQVDPIEVAEIMEAVSELDEQLREVLVARIWGQLSWERVGKLCGISTTTAFRRYESALKVLRSRLQAECETRT
jgi:RNA polymerase sigma-70 factor (ECF subfamily)